MEDTGANSTKEAQSFVGTRLYFHGTSLIQPASLIPEYGLLARTATLTPFLEIAQDHVFSNESLLTFWYPERGEVIKPVLSGTAPSVHFPDSLRAEITERIQNSDLDDFYKKTLLEKVKETTTYLPPSRLRAIAVVTDASVGDLSNELPIDDPMILSKYVNSKDVLIQNLMRKLGKMKIIFLDPELGPRKLAEDMLRTTLEHYLLLIGLEVSYAKKYDKPELQANQAALKQKLDQLRKVKFEEPVYERYRQMLVSALSNLVSNPS
ncbi:MAG: hypothetical protein M1372_02830 [Patescibacteria group bacterium]|nr:hypothetical protein [Patescibacteria group bacterium]